MAAEHKVVLQSPAPVVEADVDGIVSVQQARLVPQLKIDTIEQVADVATDVRIIEHCFVKVKNVRAFTTLSKFATHNS